MKAITSVTEAATGLVIVTVSNLNIPGHPSVNYHLHIEGDGRYRVVGEFDAETMVRDLFAALCLTFDRIEDELRARREASTDYLIALACEMGQEYVLRYDDIARSQYGAPDTGRYLLSDDDDESCRRATTKRVAALAKGSIDADYTPAEREEDLVPVLANLDLESEDWEGAKVVRRVLQGAIQ